MKVVPCSKPAENYRLSKGLLGCTEEQKLEMLAWQKMSVVKINDIPAVHAIGGTGGGPKVNEED